MVIFPSQGDEVVLQSIFTSHGEHVKICLAAEGFGTRLCRLEPISNCKVSSLQDIYAHIEKVQVSEGGGAVGLKNWTCKWKNLDKS